MSQCYNRFRLQQMLVAGLFKLLVDSSSHTQIGVEYGLRANKLQQQLPIFIHGAAENRTAKLLPALPPVAKLQVIPSMVAFLRSLPVLPLSAPDMGLNILVKLARADVTNVELFNTASSF